MSTVTLSPQEAHDRLQSDSVVTYVDVRTVAEFAEGHPKGKVVNIPVEFYHPTTNAVYPNDSFLLVVENQCDQATPLIVGCSNGDRAQKGAEKLREAGYADVSVMADGFDGWRRQQLPTTTDNRDGISYVSLLTRAKRKGKKKAAH